MKLNQVIAIEKGVKATAQAAIDTLYKAFQKPSLFEGFTKVYKKHNEADEDAPPQRQHVQAGGGVVQAGQQLPCLDPITDLTESCFPQGLLHRELAADLVECGHCGLG